MFIELSDGDELVSDSSTDGHSEVLEAGERPSMNVSLCISGRIGHGSVVNGIYDRLSGCDWDGREVFVHRDPIPPGFSGATGKTLKLYWSSENMSWAISTTLGSRSVLAYHPTDIFVDSREIVRSFGLWVIASITGAYTPDPAVKIGVFEASATDPVEGVSDQSDSSLALDKPNDSHIPNLIKNNPCNSQLAVKTMAAQDTCGLGGPAAGSDDDGRNGSPCGLGGPAAGSDDDGRNGSPCGLGGPAAGSDDDGQDGRLQRRPSIGRRIWATAHRKSISVVKTVKRKISKIARGELPSRAVARAYEHFLASEDDGARTSAAIEIFRVVQLPQRADDSSIRLAHANLLCWEALLDYVEDGVFSIECVDAIVAIMLHDGLNLHMLAGVTAGSKKLDEQSEDEGGVFAKACRMFVRTQQCVTASLVTTGVGGIMRNFAAKVLAINYYFLPGLAHAIVGGASAATAPNGRRSLKIHRRLFEGASNQRETLKKSIPVGTLRRFEVIHGVCGVTTQPKTMCWEENRKSSSVSSIIKEYNGYFDDYEPQKPIGWLKRLIPSSSDVSPANMYFFSIFLGMLFRIAQQMFVFTHFESKSDQRLGTNEKRVVGTCFLPGFSILSGTFLQMALTSNLSLSVT